jgi:cytochrome oxidase assembly protein ShyY1
MIKRAIGRILSESLYFVGDLISYPMTWYGLAWIYPIYNCIMLWSDSIQTWSGASGPWTRKL